MMMTSSTSVFLLVIALSLLTAKTDLAEEADALRTFINHVKLPHKSKYKWPEKSVDPCSGWAGVICSAGNLAVDTLKIPGASLVGNIPLSSIGKLTALRVLSLHDNALNGSLPDDFVNLEKLTHVYLYKNKFSGEFPSIMAKWTELVALDVSYNNFSGTFDNVRSHSSKLVKFNVSNNNLSGQIPSSLDRFPAPMFSGNINLCGEPLSKTCANTTQQPSPSSDSTSSDDDKKKNKLSTGHIVAITVGSAFILLISSWCLGKKWRRAVKQKKLPGVAEMAADAKAKEEAGETGTSSSKDDITGTSMEGERSK